ncbi:MAG: DUF2807 domain-containing protein [Bacteroidales bacterium]|nr:DUF2807 domain-containing protein [Bacteroidales bacterium]
MKRILYMAATVLLCTSCFHVNTNWKGGKDSIKGEGPVVSKSFDLKDFDRIVINGHADATFTQSDTYEVTLRAQENIFSYVDFRVEGTTLILETKEKRSVRSTEYDVTVKAPALSRIEVNGAADFDIPAGLTCDGDFQIEVNGAGDLSFHAVRCNDLSIMVNGAADADLKAIDVQRLKVEVNGAGDVNVDGKAGAADLSVNGAGDIDATGLQVSGEVNKRASGLAKIKH